MKKSLLLIPILFFLYLPYTLPQIISTKYLDGVSITEIINEDGNIWVSTYGKGIFKYSVNDDQWTEYSTKKGNLENDFFYSLAVSKDYVWAGCGWPLYFRN